jgi:hypothetical protein
MKARTDEDLLKNIEASTVRLPESGCWIWMRGLDKDGYGQAWRRNRPIRAHRLSWLLHKGELQSGLVLMHACDTPSCVNPEHLAEGTQQANNDDKIKKGRLRVACGDDHYLRRNPTARSGDKSSHAKVTDAQALEIRRRFASGELQRMLAAEYGITRSAISGIVTSRTFSHITTTA